MNPYAPAIKAKFAKVSSKLARFDSGLDNLLEFVLDESAAHNEREAALSKKIQYLERDKAVAYRKVAGLRQEITELYNDAHKEISSLRANLALKDNTIARLQGSPRAYRINRPAPGSRTFSPVQEEGSNGLLFSGSGAAGGGEGPVGIRAPPRIKREREEECEEDCFDSYHESDWDEDDEEKDPRHRLPPRRRSRRTQEEEEGLEDNMF